MFVIAAGCYEQLVLGYKITLQEDKSLKHSPYFTDHAQSGCIRCLAAGSNFVASGSTDETICLYDMRLGEELGALQGHQGAVNQLSFPDTEHLVSCSDDGDINIWEASSNGTLLKALRGHKGRVTSFAIHPSGKLGMSVSPKDGSLRTWNLLSGRPVFIKNFKKLQPELIRWSEDGSHYVVASKSVFQVFELESAVCLFEESENDIIMTMEFLPVLKHLVLVIGLGSGEVKLISLPDGKHIRTFKAHENRIKSLSPVSPPTSFNRDASEVWLVTASSDEHIKLWSLTHDTYTDANNNDKVELLIDIDTKARLTCVTCWHENLAEKRVLELEQAGEIGKATEEKKKRKRKRKHTEPAQKQQKTT